MPEAAALYHAGPQSGDRRPAPSRLALVQAFLNSHYSLGADRGADRFATPAGVRGWMAERALPAGRITRGDAERLIVCREALRAMTAEHAGAPADPDAAGILTGAATGATVGYAVDAGGEAVPVPVGSGVPCLLGIVLAAVHEAQAMRRWHRLKACPGPHCGWAFYDHSRNCASSWCSMSVCGGRDKARAYRRRSREH